MKANNKYSDIRGFGKNWEHASEQWKTYSFPSQELNYED